MGSKLKNIIQWLASKWHQFWSWYKGLYQGQPLWKKTLAAICSFFACCIFYAFAVQVNLFWLFGDSPSVYEIIHPKTQVASEVYSDDGKYLHKFFNENRTPVKYEEISPNFINCLVATEDERFYSHHGIDYIGLFAAAKDAAMGRARGASTITQQLVKNIHKMRSKNAGLLGHIPGVRMLIMKSKEMIIATEIELFCSKEEILTMYANTVDFGSNAFGIKTAAKTYFDTTPAELKIEEAAVLVGLLKATTAYNPKINPVNSQRRRDVVIDNLVSHKKLSRHEADSIKAIPIGESLKFSVENVFDGKALYFRQAVLNELRDVAPELDPYTDGLKIYTTLDSRMQQYAEEAVLQHMKQLQGNFNSHWGTQDPWVDEHNNTLPRFLDEKIKQTDTYRYLAARYPDNPDIIREKLNEKHNVKLFSYEGTKEAYMSSYDSLRYMLRFMHTGFIAIEPTTGYVRAYVGDVDFKTWQHDNVRASHQPGSTFKLFVYSAAMKLGLTPADRRRDEAIEMKTMDKGKEVIWRPHNANGYCTGANMSLRSAFAQSINTIAVKLGQECGIKNVIQTAHDMGINSELDAAPSLALGACDVTPYELISAYTTVANYGTHVEPYCITRIEDHNGKVLYEAKKPKARVALSEKEAYFMQVLLEAGVEGGTSASLRSDTYLGSWYYKKQLSLGGKTGTSNNHADAWFVGVTPNLVGGAWVGGEYRQIHFRTGALGQGSKAALPIFGRFMKKVLDTPDLAKRYLANYTVPVGVDPNAMSESVEPYEADSTARDTIAMPELPEYEGDGLDAVLEEGHAEPQNTEKAAEKPAEPKKTPVKHDDDDLFN